MINSIMNVLGSIVMLGIMVGTIAIFLRGIKNTELLKNAKAGRNEILSTLSLTRQHQTEILEGQEAIRKGQTEILEGQAAIQKSQEASHMLLDAKCTPDKRLNWLERSIEITGTLDTLKKWIDAGLFDIDEMGKSLWPLALRIARMGNIKLLMELAELGATMIQDDGENKVVYVKHFPIKSIKKLVLAEEISGIEFLIKNGLCPNIVIDHENDDTLADVAIRAKKIGLILPLLKLGVNFTEQDGDKEAAISLFKGDPEADMLKVILSFVNNKTEA